jgi:hypothetical protein
MIALTTTVLNWYQQKKGPRLFASVLAKQHRVSIHAVVNANAASKDKPLGHNFGNTMALLYLRRKREPITVYYLISLREPHRNNADRILKRWIRAKGR